MVKIQGKQKAQHKNSKQQSMNMIMTNNTKTHCINSIQQVRLTPQSVILKQGSEKKSWIVVMMIMMCLETLILWNCISDSKARATAKGINLTIDSMWFETVRNNFLGNIFIWRVANES